MYYHSNLSRWLYSQGGKTEPVSSIRLWGHWITVGHIGLCCENCLLSCIGPVWESTLLTLGLLEKYSPMFLLTLLPRRLMPLGSWNVPTLLPSLQSSWVAPSLLYLSTVNSLHWTLGGLKMNSLHWTFGGLNSGRCGLRWGFKGSRKKKKESSSSSEEWVSVGIG